MGRIGLTSNKLKAVAIISMIIDHIAYYFYYMMPSTIYLVCRILGRFSMPIFVFLIVQGYLKTSNIKKYITRIFKYAIVTQVLISIISIFNTTYIPSYEVNVYEMLNILFSFCLSLCLIYIIDKRNKFFDSCVYDWIMKVIIFVLIITIYIVSNIDYKFIIPTMAILMYVNEIINNKGTKFNKYIYSITLFFIIFILFIIQEEIVLRFSIFSAIFILLYNGELGKKSIKLKRLFYYIFPIQHFILYLLAMLIYIVV